MQQLDFEKQLERAVAALIAGCADHIHTADTLPEHPEYPYIFVLADKTEDAGFGELGVFSTDLMITVESYRADDSSGAAHHAIVSGVRAALYAPALAGRIAAAIPGYTIYGAVMNQAFTGAETRTRSLTFQLNLKFSPTA